jgi:N4-gp56 family major capsid protein
MAGEFAPTGAVSAAQASAAGFVPQIWSDEIFASYQKNLVMAALVKKLSVVGKKGDVVHVPKPTRGAASAKASATAVTLLTESGIDVEVSLNQHWHYARLIEDFADKQAVSSLRRFYTADAGYALGKAVDDFLLSLFRNVNGGGGTLAYNKAVIGSNGSTLYTSGAPNAAAITDAGIRRVIQQLDDADVPQEGRFMVIPPVARNVIMGLARFSEQAFVGNGDVIKNGRLGNIYGIETFVTSSCETATGGARIGIIGHEESLVLCEQMAPRVQTESKLEHIATLLVADTLFGAAELRDEAAVAIAMPA